MERVNGIFTHPLYQDALCVIERAEKNRIFCKHDMEHFLSVARLARLYALQEGAGIPKPVIYGAALLHDIGRGQEYESGLPHHEASAALAERILAVSGFAEEDQALILDAILFHRTDSRNSEKGLRGLLYRADKASRNCFVCRAQGDCKWPENQRNLEIRD